MNAFQKIGTIFAITGMVSVLVAKSSQTAGVTKAIFGGISQWQKTAQGRG
ncbi:hypothetical protein GA0115240_105810 [Streptomyces sp. DvalAA-14]|nr:MULTISPECIES: hypothetical protein [unclassified Streptomyces]MYS19159.1 hypothetical protein [Streptomyces sp. SID4948]SCD38076.1 hypothetical protein GA0115240_105810 [Streptomyces sp. DvalAA-14]